MSRDIDYEMNTEVHVVSSAMTDEDYIMSSDEQPY